MEEKTRKTSTRKKVQNIALHVEDEPKLKNEIEQEIYRLIALDKSLPDIAKCLGIKFNIPRNKVQEWLSKCRTVNELKKNIAEDYN